MSPLIVTFLLSSLGLGTALTFASSHWLLAWMGLEINTLAILPLMSQHPNPRAVEAAMKYFLVQATAAAMLLFATTTNAWLTGQWDLNQMAHPLPITIITLALALKIGLAPLHSWLPEVLQGLNLSTGLILSTWQKLAPFAIILQIQHFNPTLTIFLALLSILVGGWGGLNQTQLRKILAYSSIAHLGWMMLIIPFNPPLTLMALFTYIIMTASTFLILKINKTTTLNTLATSWAKTPVISMMMAPVLLSLGGLPPLTGFGPKWLILQEMVKQHLALAATVAALAALLSLYFYLRICYAIAYTMPPHTLTSTTPWRHLFPKGALLLAFFTLLTLLLLPLAPLIVALLAR